MPELKTTCTGINKTPVLVYNTAREMYIYDMVCYDNMYNSDTTVQVKSALYALVL